MPAKILPLKDVIEATSKSRSLIYKEMQLGVFPRSIRVGGRRVGWVASEVEAHIDALIKASRGEGC